ncbi:uracil-DNA glycosylase [bacterium]|nr:uracil-DNA glycosylase [bacterium]
MEQRAHAGLGSPEPSADCALCPRLVDYRAANRSAHPDWWNKPVGSFGDVSAQLLIVGLAPGVTGANRTGRPFTGDFAGDLLYDTLAAHGFSEGRYDARPDDGLALVDAMITNAVRCVPPENKPTGAEIASCRAFLQARLETTPRVAAIVALGRIAHESVIRALGGRLADHTFGHGVRHSLFVGDRPVELFDSYHCSRYNTNTGRLTPEMFHEVFAAVRAFLDGRRRD